MGDKPTKVDGSSAGGSGIGIKYGGDYDARGIIFGSEPKYYGEGPCDEFFLYPDLFLPCPKHIFPFHPCPKYIFPLPPLFCDEPPQKIQYFKVKSEREAANERVAGFINDRAGKEIIPLSDVDSIEVSKGRVNDGELKIRVVTRSLFDDVPKVRLFIVKADGTIYEEDMEENRVKAGEMSREDASALIASLYGKKELGRNPVPSDRHIESVTKDINSEDIDILSLMKDTPPDIYFSPHPQEGINNSHGFDLFPLFIRF